MVLLLWKNKPSVRMKASSSSPSFLGDGLVFVRLRLVLFWANDIRRPRRAVYGKLTEGNEICRRSLLKILTSIFAPLLETAAPWLVSLAAVRRLAGKSKLAVPRAFAALAFAISSSSIRSFSVRRKGVLLLLRDLLLDLHLGRSSGYTVRPKP